jgi:hypothetical protein
VGFRHNGLITAPALLSSFPRRGTPKRVIRIAAALIGAFKAAVRPAPSPSVHAHLAFHYFPLSLPNRAASDPHALERIHREWVNSTALTAPRWSP